MEKTAVNMKTIRMDNVIAPRLGFRDSATSLFTQLRDLESDVIQLDFKGVKFMSRTFAHEYLKQKSDFPEKKILEANVPDYIGTMFSAVDESIKNPRKLKLKPSKIIPLT